MATVAGVGAGSGSGAAAGSGFSALSSEDFAKVIFAELSKQDPLQPNDTNALLQQMSSLRSIQSNMDLTNSLKSLVSQNEFASAATLIGRGVSGLTDQGQRVAGIARAIARTDDGTIVQLDTGERVKVSRIDSIVTEAAVPPAGGSNDGSGS